MAATAPRRRLQKTERRRIIEEAACVLFAERGYAATRLEDIATEAGVTKQLIYQHFRTKKELHLDLLAKHRDALLSRLAQSMGEPGPLSERIPRAVEGWYEHVEAHPYAWAMLFRDTSGDPEIQAFYRGLQDSARAAIAVLIQADPEFDVPDDELQPLAEFVRASVTGVALWWADNRSTPRSTVVSVVVGMLADGLQRTHVATLDRKFSGPGPVAVTPPIP